MTTTLLYCCFSKEFVRRKDGYYFANADYFQKLSQHFKTLHLLVPLVRYPPREEYRKFRKLQSVKINVIGTKAYENRFLWRVQEIFWSFQSVLKFREWQRKADVVLMTVPSALPYLAFLPLLNKPLAVTIGGDEQEVYKFSNTLRTKIERYSGLLNLRQSIEGLLLRRADAIICPNFEFKDRIASRYGLLESQMHVVPLGIDINVYRPFGLGLKQEMRKRLGLKSNDLVLGFVAPYISQSKGADILMKAFSRLRLMKSRLKLLLVGKDVFGIRRHPSVIHVGRVEKKRMPHYYNVMDIFVFPSRSETGPRVVMEAMACGVPVIASNVGATPQWIKDGQNGFLVKPNDVERIVNCCQKLLDDEELRIKIGKNARKFAVENFVSTEVAIQKIAKIIQDISRYRKRKGFNISESRNFNTF